jgi:hypothetical protein
MDFAHCHIERRLAHLRQPDQGCFLVDARPLEVAAEVTEHAGGGAIVTAARHRDQPLPAARMHAAEGAGEFIGIV